MRVPGVGCNREVVIGIRLLTDPGLNAHGRAMGVIKSSDAQSAEGYPSTGTSSALAHGLAAEAHWLATRERVAAAPRTRLRLRPRDSGRASTALGARHNRDPRHQIRVLGYPRVEFDVSGRSQCDHDARVRYQEA